MGGIINSITANDFNSDGLFDIAVANETYNEVRILKNTSSAGNISFINAATVAAAGTQPESIISADFNGDNLPDIAVSNWQSANISIIQNTTVSGTISFGNSINYTSYANPNALAVGDLVPDGYPEILSVSNATGFNVFANNATATIGFNNAYSRPYPSTGLKSAMADFDNDGKNDIATTSFALRVNVYRNTSGSPIITSFNPSVGKTGDTIIISGHNFKLGTISKVTFGGDTALSFKVRNDSTIRANVGFGATGDVVVVSTLGEGRKAGFYYGCKSDTLTFIGCNGTYIYKGIAYVNSISISDTIKTITGIDSIYRQVNILIKNIVPSVDSFKIIGCNHITYMGKTYYFTTIVLDTLRTLQGCDSIYEVRSLVINYTASTKYITLVGCNEVVYNGKNYYTPTVLRDTLRTQQGCDSIYNIINISLGLISKTVTAYITNSNDSTVSIINVDSNKVVKTIHSGGGAFGVAVHPNGLRVYVANKSDSTISIINTSSSSVIKYIKVGQHPYCLSINPDGSRIYVANRGSGTVSVINTLNDSVIATIFVGLNPEGVGVSPDGFRVYVANYGSNSISVIDAVSNLLVTSIDVGSEPYGVTISQDNTKVYVTNHSSSSVSVINASLNSVIATIPVGNGPLGICLNYAGTQLYVANTYSNSVSVINTSNNNVVSTVPVLQSPFGISITPDDTQLYVVCYIDDRVCIINTANNLLAGNIIVGSYPGAPGNFITKVFSQMTAISNSVYLKNCDSITYKNLTYTSNTVIIDTIKSSAGCDSVYQNVFISINNNGLSGNFITPLHKPIKSVKTNLNQHSTLQANSFYNYTCLPKDSLQTLRPTKNNDITKANGVTSIDALLTQRHILNTTKLKGAYKLIAADVDGNKVINSVDVLRIKRLILGTDTTFTKTSCNSKNR